MPDQATPQVPYTPARFPSEDALLVEYDKTQDSAQHHDNLVWTVTGFAWGGSAVFMGFIVDKLADENPPVYVLLALSIVGIYLTRFLYSMQSDFQHIRRNKYNRCKEIEEIMGMKQHTGLPYVPGTQTKKYRIMLWLFAMAWGVIIVKLLMVIFGVVLQFSLNIVPTDQSPRPTSSVDAPGPKR